MTHLKAPNAGEGLTMDTQVTARVAYLAMHRFISVYMDRCTPPDEDLILLVSELQLWDVVGGGKAPMDAGIFPEWLECIEAVLDAEQGGGEYTEADIQLTPPKR